MGLEAEATFAEEGKEVVLKSYLNRSFRDACEFDHVNTELA